MRPRIFQGYVVLLLVTTLTKFLFFVWQFLLIQQHLFMRYFWNHCHQAADMVWKAPFCWDNLMDLGFAIHEAALLKLEAVQILFYLAFISSRFCWIWCRKLTFLCQFWAVFGLILPVQSQFSAWNSAKLESRRIEIENILNCLMFQQSSFVYSKA